MFRFWGARDENSGMTRWGEEGGFCSMPLRGWIVPVGDAIPDRRGGLPSGAWRDAFPSGAWERQGGGAWERQGGGAII